MSHERKTTAVSKSKDLTTFKLPGVPKYPSVSSEKGDFVAVILDDAVCVLNFKTTDESGIPTVIMIQNPAVKAVTFVPDSNQLVCVVSKYAMLWDLNHPVAPEKIIFLEPQLKDGDNVTVLCTRRGDTTVVCKAAATNEITWKTFNLFHNDKQAKLVDDRHPSFDMERMAITTSSYHHSRFFILDEKSDLFTWEPFNQSQQFMLKRIDVAKPDHLKPHRLLGGVDYLAIVYEDTTSKNSFLTVKIYRSNQTKLIEEAEIPDRINNQLPMQFFVNQFYYFKAGTHECHVFELEKMISRFVCQFAEPASLLTIHDKMAIRSTGDCVIYPSREALKQQDLKADQLNARQAIENVLTRDTAGIVLGYLDLSEKYLSAQMNVDLHGSLQPLKGPFFVQNIEAYPSIWDSRTGDDQPLLFSSLQALKLKPDGLSRVLALSGDKIIQIYYHEKKLVIYDLKTLQQGKPLTQGLVLNFSPQMKSCSLGVHLRSCVLPDDRIVLAGDLSEHLMLIDPTSQESVNKTKIYSIKSLANNNHGFVDKLTVISPNFIALEVNSNCYLCEVESRQSNNWRSFGMRFKKELCYTAKYIVDSNQFLVSHFNDLLLCQFDREKQDFTHPKKIFRNYYGKRTSGINILPDGGFLFSVEDNIYRYDKNQKGSLLFSFSQGNLRSFFVKENGTLGVFSWEKNSDAITKLFLYRIPELLALYPETPVNETKAALPESKKPAPLSQLFTEPLASAVPTESERVNREIDKMIDTYLRKFHLFNQGHKQKTMPPEQANYLAIASGLLELKRLVSLGDLTMQDCIEAAKKTSGTFHDFMTNDADAKKLMEKIRGLNASSSPKLT